MASTITRTQFSQQYDPAIQYMFSEMIREKDPKLVEKIFQLLDGKKMKEIKIGAISGLPVAVADENEGDAAFMVQPYQGRHLTLTSATYKIGYRITEEAMEDDLKGEIPKIPQRLVPALLDTKEFLGAAILDNAHSGSHLGADSKALCADDHPNYSGLSGTWDNDLGAVELIYSGLESAIVAGRRMTTYQGIPMPLKPKALVVPPNLEFQAHQVVFNPNQSDTAMRNINAISQRYPGLEIIVNPYLQTTQKWFVLFEPADETQGLLFVWRRKPMAPVTEAIGAGQGFRVFSSMRCTASFFEQKNLIGSQGV